MKINSELIQNLFFVILLFSYSIFLSLLLPARSWETDYGSYYSLSMFLDKNNVLYENMFSHSGPFYFFFIKIVSIFIGWGWKSSIITYALVYFILFLSILFSCNKLKLNFIETGLVLLLTISYQKYFGSNVCLQIFFNIFLVLLILNLFLFLINNLNKKNLFISVFFLSLLVLTRIDGAIYGCLILIIYIYYLMLEKPKIKSIIVDLVIFFLIFFLLFIFFKLFFHYSLKGYFDHNIVFNLKYGTLNDTLNNFAFYLDLTPKKLTLSVILVLLTSIILSPKKNDSLISYYLLFLSFTILFFIYQLEINNNLIFFLSLIFNVSVLFYLSFQNKIWILLFLAMISYLISVFIFNYAGSYKLYYTAMLHPSYISIFISVLMIIKRININKFKFFTLIIFLFFISDQYKKHIKFILSELTKENNLSFENNIKDFYYDENLIEKNELIIFQKENNLKVICGRGWINIFSNSKPDGNIYDWWYFTDVFFQTNYFNNDYEKFISGKLGRKFLIDKSCTNLTKKISSKLKFVLQNSILIKEINFFKNTYQIRSLLL